MRKNIKRLFSMTIAALFVVAGTTGIEFNASAETKAATDVVVFADSNLETCISESEGLEVGNITVADMEALYTLYCADDGIKDISGLEYATKINNLSLPRNQVTDLSPISGLTNLSMLDLKDNTIEDLTPINELTNLANLSVGNNPIKDLTPISGLVNLEFLSLTGTAITDLSPVSNLVLLEGIQFGFTEVSDISPLANLTNLDQMSAPEAAIEDLSPLANLPKLSRVTISGNKVRDFSPLGSLSALTYISVYGQKITLEDITISNSKEIFATVIDIDGNEIQVSLGTPKNAGLNELGGVYADDVIVAGKSTSFRVEFIQNVTLETVVPEVPEEKPTPEVPEEKPTPEVPEEKPTTEVPTTVVPEVPTVEKTEDKVIEPVKVTESKTVKTETLAETGNSFAYSLALCVATLVGLVFIKKQVKL